MLGFMSLVIGSLLNTQAQNSSLPGNAGSPADKPAFADKIGVELEGLSDGGRSKPFLDLAKTLRPWIQTSGGNPAPLDREGWPTSDATTVLFDIRPFGSWAPPVDDPDKFQPDWSGTYKLSFNGQAVIQFPEGPDMKLVDQKYDPAANLTTADVVVPRGAGLLIASFTQTKRTADSADGSGITNLRVLRPGYGRETTELFTNDFLRSLKPFAVLRFMDWLATNHNPGPIRISFPELPANTSAAPREAPDFRLNDTRNPSLGSRIGAAEVERVARLAITPG